MKAKIYIVFLLSIHFSLNAQISNIKWIKTAIGSKDEWFSFIKTDQDGNVYLIGEFESNSLLIEGVNLENKADTSLNNFGNLYIIKYSNTGRLIWAKSIQSNGYLGEPTKFEISKTRKLIMCFSIVTGSYIKFNNELINLPKDFQGIFILEIDVNGNIIWTKGISDQITCIATGGIVFTKDDEVVIGGISYSGIMKELDGSLVLKDSTNKSLQFLLKFDKEGKIKWSKTFGSQSSEYLSAITIDFSNNIVVYGVFGGYQFTIDSFTLFNHSKKGNNLNSWDTYLTKLDSTGKTIWLTSIYGTKDDGSIDKIITDSENNIYAAGIFNSDTIHFGKEVKLFRTKPIQPGWDLFYSKYNSEGILQWAKKIDNGVVGILDFLTETVSPEGRLILSGNYDNTAFKSGDILLPSYGLNDVFYFECDKDGNIVSKGSLGSDDYEWISDIHLDNQSNLYMSGMYGSNELMIGNTTLVNTAKDGSTDMYLIKFCLDSINSTFNLKIDPKLEIVYNSLEQSINLIGNEILDKCNLRIFSVSGQLIFAREINGNEKIIKIPSLLNGIYFVCLRMNNKISTFKIVQN